MSNSTPSQVGTHFNRVRSLTLFTTFLTGFTGLVYEVTWHKYLANVLGSQAQATAVILACFLGGLSIGYGFFGKISFNKSPQSLVKIVGWIEVLIGVWAVFFPELIKILQMVTSSVPDATILSSVVEKGGAFLLLSVPTICMGGTLPLLTQALSKDLKDSSKFHARVYAINTGGAFLGCLMAGFFIIPAFGLPLTLIYLAAINIVSGLFLVGISKFLNPEKIGSSNQPSESSKEQNQTTNSLPYVFSCAIAILAGFYSIALQTVFIRLTGITMGSSEYSFSMVVAVYIFLLAFGAWKLATVKIEKNDLFKNQLVLVVSAVALYFSVPYWPYCAHLIRISFSNATLSFYAYHATMCLFFGLLFAIPVGAMGRTMPLLFGVTRLTHIKVGDLIGKLYGWNTIGCVFGALVGGYFALFILNLDQVFMASIALMLLSLFLTQPKMASQKRTYQLGFASLVIASVFIPKWPQERLAFGTFRVTAENKHSLSGAEEFHKDLIGGKEILYYEDGPNTSITFAEFKDKEAGESQEIKRMVYVNGKSDGYTAGEDKKNMYLVAHIPSLLQSSKSEHAAIIGFGTGMSVGAADAHENYKTIDIFEISSKMRDNAEHFDFISGNSTTNPKMRWVIGDAYKTLPQQNKKYAAIISEPSNPWVTGVERIFALEFIQQASRFLADGGVYAQWLQTYSISEETFGMIINTYKSVFKHLHLFRVSQGDTILVGSNKEFGAESFNLLAERFHSKKINLQMKEVEISSWQEVLGMEYWIRPQTFKDFGLHTLDFPKLSHLAGRDFFHRKNIDLTRISRSEPLRLNADQNRSETLLFQSFNSRPESPQESIEASLPGMCQGMNKNNMNKNHLRMNLRCLRTVFDLAIANPDAYKKAYPDDKFSIIRKIHSAKNLNIINIESVDEYMAYNYLFNTHRSSDKTRPLVILNNRNICTKSPSQKEAKVCFIEAAFSLANSGLLKEAKVITDEYFKTNTEISALEIKRYEDKLQEAAETFKTLTAH